MLQVLGSRLQVTNLKKVKTRGTRDGIDNKDDPALKNYRKKQLMVE